MKIICTQENLKAGLLTVGRIISSSSTLPILNNVLIKTENGMLKISSTNLEIAITTHIRCKVEEDGEVTVICKAISDLVNNLPNKNLELKTENNQLGIETENYHTSIKTLPAEDFPLIPVLDGGEPLSVDAESLKGAIDEVVFAASTNQTQPEIAGVLFSFEEEKLKIVATDRYRLAEKKITLEKKKTTSQEVIVPQKTVVELSRIIGNSKGGVEIMLSETQIVFSFNETKIISRVIDGQYPDYKQIIPSSFATTITTEKQPLVSALRTAGIFSHSTNSVKLDYDQGKQSLILATESSDLGKGVVELPSVVEGKGGSVMLNNHYILDCLLSMDSSRVVIKIIDDSSPSLVLPDGDDSYIYLIMPIKS